MPDKPSNPSGLHADHGQELESLRDDAFQHVRDALADTDICIWDFNLRTGEIRRTNLPRSLGYPAGGEPATGEAWLKLLHPDDADRAMQVLEQCTTGKTRDFECEYRVKTNTGEWCWLFDRGHVVERDDAGRPVRIVGTSVDISKQKRAEQELCAREAQLRLLVTQLPAVLWTTDRDLRFTSSTGAALSQIELVEGQVVGLTLYEYLETDDPTFLPIAKHLEALRGESVEYEFTWKDTVFLVNVEPMRAQNGEIVGTIGLAHDVTERKQYEEQLLRQSESERLLRRELDHRVRNNLSSLISLIELTADSAREIDDFATAIAGRIRAMASAHDCLSGDRATPLGIRSLLETLTPNAYIGRIIYAGKDVSISTERVNALAMVLHELITNSIKYGALSNEAGSILIEGDARVSGESPTTVITWREQGGPTIDNPPELGTGVRIVEGIVRSDLQGEIELSFDPSGATHTITIPVTTRNTPHPQDEQPAPTTTGA